MDLILWRHAEAEEARAGQEDLARVLTARGEKQAARVGPWLDHHLPEGTRVRCSPARRCEQTVRALGRKYKLKGALAPDADADELLALVQWPSGRHAVLVVGHQPALGQVVARLLGLQDGHCAVRKGSVWWLRSREREGDVQTVVWAVQNPETVQGQHAPAAGPRTLGGP